MFYSISDQSSLGLVYAIGHCRSRLQCKSLQVFGVTWPCCLRFGLRKISSAFMGRGIELDMSIYVIHDMLGGFWEKIQIVRLQCNSGAFRRESSLIFRIRGNLQLELCPDKLSDSVYGKRNSARTTT